MTTVPDTPRPDILCIGAMLWDVIGRTPGHMKAGDDVPGPPNHSLWEILRVSLELMRRPDLATLCLARDLNQIHLDQIVGTI